MSELAINTPQALVQCKNVTITWTGGVGMLCPPYQAQEGIEV
jgi:hypothetical protein